jgi:hypothetical protein
MRTGEPDDLLLGRIDVADIVITLPDRTQVYDPRVLSRCNVHLDTRAIIYWSFVIHQGMSADGTLHPQ